MNTDLSESQGYRIETVFLITDKNFSAINSSIVREIKKNNGEISQFVTNEDKLIINT